ncbi:DMT family transporter [Oceanobacillus sp. CFH 90083]|uniref:DMT family transporter n=1 Tax=Oceanobacillus sp. CFH 90083 TaxID=2592336 RepID=UPI001D13294B|nr:DMT family transporter [Oceanobacillus sp. CFH 90083]
MITIEKKGHILNLISILMMTIGPLLSKFGVLEISPSKAAIINTITIILATYCYGLISKKRTRFYKDKEILLLAVFNSLGVIFLYLSTSLLSPVEIGFIGRFYTVFAIIFSIFILKERLTKRESIFILIAVIGIFLFVETDGVLGANLIGIVYAFLYTMFFALANIYIKKTMSAERDSNSILFTNNCVTLIFVILFGLFSQDLFDGQYSLNGISFIVVSSLLTGFIGTLFLYEALKYLRFAIANTIRAFSPILLALFSYPFFPVEITIPKILGAVVILLSIFLLTTSKGEESKEKKKAM